MARIRTIKPEFWIDERVGECSPTARLLFIATWNFADDNGNLERSARQLKAQVFPYDPFEVEPLLLELIHVGLLEEYEVSGHKYLHISNFEKHQKIEKKSAARFPLPDHSPTAPRLVGTGREGRGREEEGMVPPPDSDLIVLEIINTHPKGKQYRDPIEIPNVLSSAVVRAIGTDGVEAVMSGTRGYAESLDDPKFAEKPTDFYREFHYRPEFWRTNAKPTKWESGLESVLSGISETDEEPMRISGAARDS